MLIPRAAVGLLLTTAAAAISAAAPPPPVPPVPSTPPPFSFAAPFGNNMVLQQQPAAAAIYGFGGDAVNGVRVTVTNEGNGKVYTVDAKLNVTTQPFGSPDFGVQPANTYNPWNAPLPTWKALLKPTAPGASFTISATADGGKTYIQLINVVYGDIWYCSGQSNMWLPLAHAYTRNETVAAIKAGKYTNIRLMAGNSGNAPNYPTKSGPWDPTGYGNVNGSNAWMTATQAIATGTSTGRGGTYPLFAMGAACWYYAQRLSELGITYPIGIANTAIGGQRIEEYANNATITKCSYRTGANGTTGVDAEPARVGDSVLYAKQVVPFVDMTVKGWVWYQGENNMGGVKGNSAANVGYACLQRELINGWRQAWSRTPNTTDPDAPFGIVTLASSGSEGGPHMGAMRQAQTASYGILPGPEGSVMRNTFLAQAYDLDDEWGGPMWAHLACHHNNEGNPCSAPPTHQPCLTLACCPVGGHGPFNASTCNASFAKLCTNACAAAANTPQYMGGIHPRSKKQVGDRLGTAAYNTVYGGRGSYTGPTLAGCAVSGTAGNVVAPHTLTIQFNTTLLRTDTLQLNPAKPLVRSPGWWINSTVHDHHMTVVGGTLLYVQTNASNFCFEQMLMPDDFNASTGSAESDYSYCPTWAGGAGPGGTKQNTSRSPDQTEWYGFDSGWIMLNFTKGPTASSIVVDLTPLKGETPTAVRYAWGGVDCCDMTDPLLYVTHGCVAECPIYTAESALPANPFMAKIVDGSCECIAPQVCQSQ